MSASVTRPQKVFVVDDNRDAADTLGMFLELEGYEVRVAYDGEEAIREADKFHPDVALLDIGLPGRDGYEIARHMRREQDGDLMLIAVTGYSSEDDVKRSREAGFDFHFGKPASLPALLEKIHARFGDQGTPV
jgi:DNA-binding response OmpR family regulator